MSGTDKELSQILGTLSLVKARVTVRDVGELSSHGFLDFDIAVPETGHSCTTRSIENPPAICGVQEDSIGVLDDSDRVLFEVFVKKAVCGRNDTHGWG